MKYIDEYRDKSIVSEYSEAINSIVKNDWLIMEICGGQTHSIVKYGIDELLPKRISLVHGPGCPVCVTPVEKIDKAIEIASDAKVIFCSYGDMLRVPGSEKDLLRVKSDGGDVRIIYSPLDALKIASENPDNEVVFFAVGFETTAPSNAMSVFQAKKQNIKNFSVLVSQVLVPPAIQFILSSPLNKIQGFLAAGHVCTVMGYTQYEDISEKYKIPIVVTGFEPADLMQGIYMCVKQLEEGKHKTQNQYSRVVTRDGNNNAQYLMSEVFEVTDMKWRGIGNIPLSGLKLSEKYSEFDAEIKFGLINYNKEESTKCIAGLIMQGLKKPFECSEFAQNCNPEHPLGATMVSSEGACAAFYKYRKRI
jgi:hydrogenase expression/formation protein HypD